MFHLNKKIMKKFNLMLVCMWMTISVVANTITGKVIDENGDPLPGASILVKGSQIGSITDFDGAFTIEAKSGDILVITYLGYLTSEKKVGKSNRVIFQLTASQDCLEEVVTIGYGTVRKSRHKKPRSKPYNSKSKSSVQVVSPYLFEEVNTES